MRSFGKYAGILVLTAFIAVKGSGQVVNQLVPVEKIRFVTEKIDSIAHYVRSGKVQEHAICRIKEHDRYIYHAEGITVSKKAFGLPDSIRNFFIGMHALIKHASDFYEAKAYDSAFYCLSAALDIAITHHFDEEELHDLRVAMNNNCFLKGDYTGAMKISREGLSKAEWIGDADRVAHFSNVIGYIHMKLGNFTKAEGYYTAYLKEAQKLRDTSLEAHAFYNLADLAIAQGQFDKTLTLLKESDRLYRSVKGSKLFNLKDRSVYIINKMAEAYKLKGDLPHALFLALQTIKGVEAHGHLINEYDKASYYINTGDIYNRLALPDSAIHTLRKGLHIAQYILHREFERDGFEQMAVAFSQKEIYDSAFIYQNRFLRLKDSISNEINRQEIFQQDADIQMERQQQLQRIAIERQKMWRNIIIAVALFLLLTLYFLYNRYRLRQRNRYQQELNRQQNELFNAIASAQEQERKRIAQDIHDSLGSVLSAAKLKLAEVKDNRPELGNDEKFISGIGLLDEASSELRNISHNIMPATLSKLGLIPALKNLAEKISSSKGPQVVFMAHAFDNRLDEQTEISVYRIVLELINNVVKHAAASKATVQLVKYPDYINITVEDNGRGFDVAKITDERTGIGLGNVTARVDYLKGKIDIDSMPGKGTTVIVDIPIAS